MAKARPVAPERLATPEEIAEYLQKPAKTLAQWRSQGIGPKYSKPGGHDVRYDWADVREWLATQQVATAATA